MTTQPNVHLDWDSQAAPPVRPDPATIEAIEFRAEELARQRAAGATEYASWRVVSADRKASSND
ncbi:MAG: hypothetical protein JWQ07_4252 [Ramlibacter sp.]|nr:hypothetical protein [Ramlibacter sp.]